MRILFVGDEEDYARATEGSRSDRPCSLFFAPEPLAPAECSGLDAMVMPVDRFLCLAPGIHPSVIMASGPADLVAEAFSAGCADYLRVPWSPEELLTRVRIRRGRSIAAGGERLTLEDGVLKGRRGLRRLDPAASAALVLLSANYGRMVPREALASVMGVSSCASRAVDMRMSRLRAALCETAGDETAKALRAGRIPGTRIKGYCLTGS
ncbi:MAG: response regulator transcription factor [Spirochaetales bacterium]|nr:MAG: response regulator transcription factor [Spirochaetales bacterium]